MAGLYSGCRTCIGRLLIRTISRYDNLLKQLLVGLEHNVEFLAAVGGNFLRYKTEIRHGERHALAVGKNVEASVDVSGRTAASALYHYACAYNRLAVLVDHPTRDFLLVGLLANGSGRAFVVLVENDNRLVGNHSIAQVTVFESLVEDALHRHSGHVERNVGFVVNYFITIREVIGSLLFYHLEHFFQRCLFCFHCHFLLLLCKHVAAT